MNEPQLRSSPPVVELVSKEEWSEWLEIPTTKIFRALLRKRLIEKQEDWVSGRWPLADHNAKAVGECQALKAMLELTSEQVNEGMSDDQ